VREREKEGKVDEKTVIQEAVGHVNNAGKNAANRKNKWKKEKE